MSEETTMGPQEYEAPATDPMAGPAQGAVDPMMDLEAPAGEGPALEDLVGGAAPPAGLAVLADLDDAVPAGKTASASYGFDKTLADGGKWFAWPKLGPNARVRLAMVGGKLWKSVSSRARAKYGNGGNLTPETMDRILPAMMVKSIFIAMEGVIVDAPGQPALADTAENRLRLLEEFEHLAVEMFNAANDTRNFRDDSETVLGN